MVDAYGFTEQFGSSHSFCCSLAKGKLNRVFQTIRNTFYAKPLCFLLQVWTDKKLQIKHKLQHNKKELRATGGGPNTLKSFNDLEETIIRLLSLETAVNHNGKMVIY